MEVYEIEDYYGYSTAQLVKILGARVRDYRLRSKMTQKEVSEQSGITINTIHKVETGSSTGITLSTFLSLLRAIENLENLDNIMPDMSVSPYLYRANSKKIQRVRHKQKKS